MLLPPIDTVVCDRFAATANETATGLRLGLVDLMRRNGGELCEGREDEQLWRVGAGTVKVAPVRGTPTLRRFDASGQAAAWLREQGSWSEYARLFAAEPSARVSAMDLALDRSYDPAVFLRKLVRRMRAGREFKLGRKSVPWSSCSWLVRPDQRGRDSGTVYMPRLGLDRSLRLVHYAKCVELREQRGVEIAPRTRHELRLRGAELRMQPADAVFPAALYWSKCGDSVPHRPSDVEPWRPGMHKRRFERGPMPTLDERVARLLVTGIRPVVASARELLEEAGRGDELLELLNVAIAESLPEVAAATLLVTDYEPGERRAPPLYPAEPTAVADPESVPAAASRQGA